MAKRTKGEKRAADTVVFIVEGKSDQRILELPLSELIMDNNPEFNVRFALQQKLVDQSGEELECDGCDMEEEFYISGPEYKIGGDITSSSFVTPDNIEKKITNRFIKPLVKEGGIYPRRIAKVIQIVDLDGAFLRPNRVVELSNSRSGDPFYDEASCVIESSNPDGIRARNENKKKNLEYLLSLSEIGIKIESRRIPYQIFFFSSNMDHFVHRDANVQGSKLRLADHFCRTIGLDTDRFCDFFITDSNAIGKLGYFESWKEIQNDPNSITRKTNLDCLILQLKNGII